jgi:hypothetical protein
MNVGGNGGSFSTYYALMRAWLGWNKCQEQETAAAGAGGQAVRQTSRRFLGRSRSGVCLTVGKPMTTI